jgi:hypothetical protein
LKKEDSNSWIRVYVRVRPLIRNEIGQEKILSIENDVFYNKDIIRIKQLLWRDPLLINFHKNLIEHLVKMLSSMRFLMNLNDLLIKYYKVSISVYWLMVRLDQVSYLF